jgi:nucleotide sugar dehydrogenase
VPAAHQIPKVVSGLDDVVPGSLDQIVLLYEQVFDRVVPVSKPEVAEMTKLYENCQRMMCIAYANEMANACEAHDIDPYEVCDAAATKPFGYMPYSPGPGVGGHCIPVNPYYLLSNNEFPILQAATESMWQRPLDHARKCMASLRDSKPWLFKADREARVLVVGVGFKPGQSTLSNSPGLALIRGLTESENIEIDFADSMVSQEMVPWVQRLDDEDWTLEGLEDYDMIVVTIRQVGHDFSILDSLQRPLVKFLCR